MSRTLYIGRKTLKISEFLEASKSDTSLTAQLDRAAADAMLQSSQFIHNIAKGSDPVYGVNTGVGLLSDKRVSPQDIEQLQVNIVRSHCVGVGPYLSHREARLLMLLRAHTLALGHSGVRPKVVETLLECVNRGLTPLIPSEGSVGASGDLAPLSHLALALMGEGDIIYKGETVKTSIAFKEAGIEPVRYQAKEGLALINGTQLMLMYALMSLARLSTLAKVADVVAACSTEAYQGTPRAFDPRIQRLRPHEGQTAVADNLRRLMASSAIAESHKDCGKVQDPYSFRCIPQVHGAARDVIRSISSTVLTELHSVTDNPLVFAQEKEIISGGNFHGAPLALGLDILGIATQQFASISERRLEKLINPHFSELPAFLVKHPGLNSGLMMIQVTAAALVSENKILCHPSSADTIPTSADKEDHVSMGPAAGKKLKKIIDNTERVLAIEAVCARQALWLREPLHAGRGAFTAYQKMSAIMEPIEHDRVLHKDIENMRSLLFRSDFISHVGTSIGQIY